ncbi:heavy metal-responsive transcriptional regulator [Nitrococcus mobilis]|uniref:heavy metal-responsive transcriptional regulator n=1 Tax=Nitrococcus mobilis TaxID=35797 RepID=UPI00058F3544|nr:heavy metal-responsive transcriptional regulator [Nitrococcus mobilis]
MDTARAVRIGALAHRVGVATETLRYYERLGLIAPIARSAANYRLYGEVAERRLLFIRRAQALGFSLEDIGELLSLHHRAGARAAEARRITEARLREVEAKIRDLERMRRGLAEFTASCSGEGPAAECPILASLAAPEPK